jgi:beta-aspartyl-peptidase (threonine type)
VQAAVRVLEDDPTFNAGTGACLNENGNVELDAAIMESSSLRAGAVCALPPFRNPIDIARAVLDQGRHVLYAGEGAAAFAVRAGFEPLSPDALITERARAEWKTSSGGAGGTVGAVARDAQGLLASATSTGGMVRKARGRVGDSPIIGAGTFADEAGAASATGYGEAIMRVTLGRVAVDAMRAGLAPEQAARRAVSHMVERVGGQAGIILVDGAGRVGWARSTDAMSWAALWGGHDASEGGTS